MLTEVNHRLINVAKGNVNGHDIEEIEHVVLFVSEIYNVEPELKLFNAVHSTKTLPYKEGPVIWLIV